MRWQTTGAALPWRVDAALLCSRSVAEASGSIGGSWVKQQLNANLLVVTSGSVFGYGHIILIRGYTDDNRWYVNDPYGYQVSGNYNGANVIYTWGPIAPAHFWAG